MPANQNTLPLLTRIRGEYQEMPGLNLTFRQACRLWQLEPTTCESLLKQLVADGFLVYSPAHGYALARTGFPRGGSPRTRQISAA
jgi:hypothetical protein